MDPYHFSSLYIPFQREFLVPSQQVKENTQNLLMALLNRHVNDQTLENLDSLSRGEFFVAAAEAPNDDVDLILLIKKSGLITPEDQGKALIAAAGAAVSKPHSVRVLSQGEFDEGGLLIDRNSKEFLETSDYYNTSCRSQAILKATEKGYIEVVEALLENVILRDNDNHMLNALNEAVKQNNLLLVKTLIENAYWHSDDITIALEHIDENDERYREIVAYLNSKDDDHYIKEPKIIPSAAPVFHPHHAREANSLKRKRSDEQKNDNAKPTKKLQEQMAPQIPVTHRRQVGQGRKQFQKLIERIDAKYPPTALEIGIESKRILSFLNAQEALAFSLVNKEFKQSVKQFNREAELKPIEDCLGLTIGHPSERMEALIVAAKQRTPERLKALLDAYHYSDDEKKYVLEIATKTPIDNQDTLILLMEGLIIDPKLCLTLLFSMPKERMPKKDYRTTKTRVEEIFLNYLFELEKSVRGELFIDAAARPHDNLDELRVIAASGEILDEDNGKALIAAAGAAFPKVNAINFLGERDFDEGTLDESRDEKIEADGLVGEELNTSHRSQAILKATKKGYIDVVNILLNEIIFLDNDDHMVNALKEAIKQQNLPLVHLLIENAYWNDADIDKARALADARPNKEISEYLDSL